MRDLGSAVSRLRRLFDLDADPCAVDEVLAADPALAPSVARTPGIRVPGSVDGDEIVLRALIGQQVSVAAARTTLSRLTEALGERLTLPDGELTTLFPTAQAITEHGAEVLTGPRRRIDTIIEVSAAMADGSLDVHVGADPDELTAALEAFSGVGPWTSGYVRMRVLGSPDVLLPGDVALATGAERLGVSTVDSAAWRPWRSYAGMHLWRAS
jgi:AraC family transcriptional regulator of adaptative response / DNA-3-methyladenine glycosylase II